MMADSPARVDLNGLVVRARHLDCSLFLSVAGVQGSSPTGCNVVVTSDLGYVGVFPGSAVFSAISNWHWLRSRCSLIWQKGTIIKISKSKWLTRVAPFELLAFFYM